MISIVTVKLPACRFLTVLTCACLTPCSRLWLARADIFNQNVFLRYTGDGSLDRFLSKHSDSRFPIFMCRRGASLYRTLQTSTGTPGSTPSPKKRQLPAVPLQAQLASKDRGWYRIEMEVFEKMGVRLCDWIVLNDCHDAIGWHPPPDIHRYCLSVI